MDLKNLNPLQELSRWQDRMSRLVEEGFGRGMLSGVAMPPIDVYERDGKLIVEASLPNFDERDIDVRLHDDGLEIKARHSEQIEDRRRNYIVHETTGSSFYRYISLPADARTDEAQATYENGILRVEVPLKDRPAPRRLALNKGKGQNESDRDRSRDKESR